MEQVKFTTNANGKLFNDRFSDIRFFESAKYKENIILQALYNSREFGYVKVISMRLFSFSQINDPISFLNCGKYAAQQADLLRREYAKEFDSEIMPGTKLVQVIFEYVQRDLEQQQYCLQDWWASLVEASNYKKANLGLEFPG